jgi:hypothetical protein
MPDYETLTVSFTANQDSELRDVIGWLVQELEDRYVLIEREDGKLSVLLAADLAWLPYGKTLTDLEEYFLPTYELDAQQLTDGEIADAVDGHPEEVGLLYHGDEFRHLIGPPGTLGGPHHGNVRWVNCESCRRRVRLVRNSRICPKCGGLAV